MSASPLFRRSTERNLAANRTRRYLQHELGMNVAPANRDTGNDHGPLLFGERHVHWRGQPFTGDHTHTPCCAYCASKLHGGAERYSA